MVASFTSNLLALAVPMAMIQVYDRVIPNAAYETLAALAGIVLVSVLMETVLRMARTHLLHLSGERFERAAYQQAIWSLLTEDPARNGRDDQGTNFTRLASIERLRALHTGETANLLLDLPFAGLFLLVIGLISPLIGVTVFSLLALSFLVLRITRRRILDGQAERYGIEARRHSFVSEALRGIDTVKGLRAEDFMTRRYERLLGRSAATTAQIARRIQYAQGFTAAVGTLAPVVTGVMGALLVLRGEMSVGGMAAVILLTGRIVQPVLQAVAYLSSAESARMSRDDCRKLCDLPRRSAGATPLNRIHEIALEDVSAKPDPLHDHSFEAISLSAGPGEVIALTGVGRRQMTAFLQLLRGELALSGGRIKINGAPIESYRLEDRQDRIRTLSDDSNLMDGSLLDNITSFRPEVFRDRAVELSNAFGLDTFVTQSPDGLATHVSLGAQGRLPYSTRRIAMNVAGLVTDPDVILFDHANTGLDLDTDRRLLQWLAENHRDRIVYLATPRPSYLRLATRELDLSTFLSPAYAAPSSRTHPSDDRPQEAPA